MGFFIGVIVAVVIFVIWSTGPTQAGIEAVCKTHGGLVSYDDHTWGATRGVGTAVCADHTAQKVSR